MEAHPALTDARYDAELRALPETYGAAMTHDVSDLKGAIAATSESSIITVGSGGSFTVASLMSALHEAYTGRVSRPSTPLELICNPRLAAVHPVFLISAEGKNPDILEALSRARRNSPRSIHILTNRRESPLADRARELTGIKVHNYELTVKDGYLGTNSLLMNAVLVARAYQELNNAETPLPPTIEGLTLENTKILEWVEKIDAFARTAATRTTLLLVFAPQLRPVAIDLESKLSEAALLNCQITDMRSFAHGRHLWITDRTTTTAVVALVDPLLKDLWAKTCSLFPEELPTLTVPFAGTTPQDLVSGLVAQMHIVSRIAQIQGRDPGRPNVTANGRNIHYLDIPNLIPPQVDETVGGIESKQEVLGARWPLSRSQSVLRRARETFCSALQNRTFRSLVLDYDGVLCSSHSRLEPPPAPIVETITKFATAGVVIGIASGRGDSVRDNLRRVLPQAIWPKVRLGLYNAGFIGDVSSEITKGNTSEYISHVTRIVRRLQSNGVPIKDIRPTHPHQVSVRFYEGVDATANWFVIADALRTAGLDVSRIVRSKHSVDILSPSVCKSHLVAHVIACEGIDPYEVLTVGDQGAWPGNDASLLDHRFSISVDEPSRRIDRGWKLAPAHRRDVDATIWYFEQFRLLPSGTFKVELPTTPEEVAE